MHAGRLVEDVDDRKRQHDHERRALADAVARRPHLASVHLDELLHEREA